eukprot:8394034-Alexandrium_andersonii.AAC.1
MEVAARLARCRVQLLLGPEVHPIFPGGWSSPKAGKHYHAKARAATWDLSAVEVHTHGPYCALGVPRAASDHKIKTACRRGALKPHLDKNSALGAEETMCQLGHADELAGGPRRRAAFHRTKDFTVH